LKSSYFDLGRFELKTGTLITPSEANVHTNFGFSTLFYFRVRSPYETDRWTGRGQNGCI